MKRLLVVSTLGVVLAGSSGCLHCFQRTQTARPCAPAAPCCTPAVDPCAPGGTYTTVPSMTVQPGAAVQVMPGPEAYTTP
jgi:hypothetical protein